MIFVRQLLEYYYLCYKRVCVTHLLHIISDVYVLEVLILTVKLMCLFIKQIRHLCIAETNIVLQQWYTRFIFFRNYFQCMNITNDLFWLHILPALARYPPDILHFIRVDHNFYYIGKTTTGSYLTHRQRIIGENVNV